MVATLAVLTLTVGGIFYPTCGKGRNLNPIQQVFEVYREAISTEGFA